MRSSLCLEGGLLLGLGGIKGGLQRGDLIVGFNNVGHDAAHQGERPVRLGQLESLGGPRGDYRFRRDKLWAGH